MAKDLFHDAVRRALEKEGWTITDDPLVIPAGLRNLRIDLGAERLIGAARGAEKIAVEIKSFLDDSPVTDFHKALGQFQYYEFALSQLPSERALFLAVPTDAYEDLFADPFIERLVLHYGLRIIVYEPVSETIQQWLP